MTDVKTAERQIVEVVEEPAAAPLAVRTEQALATAGAFRFAPTNFVQAVEMAKILAKSNLCPDKYRGKYEDVLIAYEMGASLGLSWMQALQNIAVINGRPSIWGDAALALVSASGILDKFQEFYEGTRPPPGVLGGDKWKPEYDGYKAVCVAKRKGWPDEHRQEFSIGDAKAAKLWGKTGHQGGDTPWITYPYRMLATRARGFALRNVAPDKLSGLILAEEAQDLPTIELSAQPDGSFGLDLIRQLSQADQDTINRAFALLEYSPARQRVVVNEYLGRADDQRPIEERVEALVKFLKGEYAKAADRPLVVNTKQEDNGKSQSKEATPQGGNSGAASEVVPAGEDRPAAAAVTRPKLDESF